MYKAVHDQTGQEIIILSPFWLKAIDRLREMDHADVLVCQGCRQPLRVKAGEVKRPHFAHKHLKACSYGTESPETLSARAVLYQWLFRYFGEAVNVEKVFPHSELSRPLDIWIERDTGSFAYWIIEGGIKLERREAILKSLAGFGAHYHPIFLSTMLNEEKKVFQSLLLTPTERTFMKTTPVDEAFAGILEAGHSLHYLDLKQQALITYRDLRLHHRPNWYKGMKKSSSLDAARVSMLTGDPMHPGEMDHLRRQQHQQQRIAKKQQAFQQREDEWVKRLEERQRDPRNRDQWGLRERQTEERGGPQPLLCDQCGQQTTDYWYTYTTEDGRRMCRCRSCVER
jgi:hypothetical protein